MGGCYGGVRVVNGTVGQIDTSSLTSQHVTNCTVTPSKYHRVNSRYLITYVRSTVRYVKEKVIYNCSPWDYAIFSVRLVSVKRVGNNV